MFNLFKLAYPKINNIKFNSLLVLFLIIIVTEVVLTAVIPEFRQYFYDVLTKKEASHLNILMMYFFFLMLGLGVAQGLKAWLAQLLARDLRIAISRKLFKKWINHSEADANAQLALTDATRLATDRYLTVLTEIVISGLIIVMLLFSAASSPLILYSSLIYSGLVCLVSIAFNRPLIRSDMAWQRSEALYRDNLTQDISHNTYYAAKTRFYDAISKYTVYINRLMYFTLFGRVKSALCSLVPFLILSPIYFSDAITFGELMAGVAHFELIVVNATIVILMYPELIKARSSGQIVLEFNQQLEKRI